MKTTIYHCSRRKRINVQSVNITIAQNRVEMSMKKSTKNTKNTNLIRL